jgi:hypothetical protein
MNQPHTPLAAPAPLLTPEAMFEREGLPVPPVPAALAALLRPHHRTLFATRPLKTSPYYLEPYLAELEADPALPAYAIVGFDGHGINSWAAHCYLVSGAAALFIQLPWGGAYLDPEPARADIADVFGWAATVQSRLEAAARQKKIPEGWRLQVAASRLRRAGWRWLAPGQDNAVRPWNQPAGMKAAILQNLDDVVNGKQVL